MKYTCLFFDHNWARSKQPAQKWSTEHRMTKQRMNGKKKYTIKNVLTIKTALLPIQGLSTLVWSDFVLGKEKQAATPCLNNQANPTVVAMQTSLAWSIKTAAPFEHQITSSQPEVPRKTWLKSAKQFWAALTRSIMPGWLRTRKSFPFPTENKD